MKKKKTVCDVCVLTGESIDQSRGPFRNVLIQQRGFGKGRRGARIFGKETKES